MGQRFILERLKNAGLLTETAFLLVLALLWLLISLSSGSQAIRILDTLECQVIYPDVELITENTKTFRCKAYLTLPRKEALRTGNDNDRLDELALLAPIFRDTLAVTVNGVPVGQARLNQWRMPARLATVPAIISLPDENFNPGQNQIEIAVSGLAGRDPALGRIYVGPEKAVISQFHRLWFVAVILPTLVLGGQIALAFMFFTIWNRRRQETALGWLALFLLLDALRGSPLVPALGIESSNVSYWSLVVPFGSAAYLMFARALVKLPSAGRTWLAWAGPVLVSVAALVADPVVATGVLMPLGGVVVGGNLLWVLIVLAVGWQRCIPEARLLFICTLLFTGLVVHDVLLLLQLIEGEVALARPGLFVLLIAIIKLMINRFTGAMTELDQTAETLRARTIQIEGQLRDADEQLRVQRETAILEQERSRLMRDLHDGLGGEMIAVLALAERGNGRDREIAYHARAALSDMRLIIASLEDYGGDFTMALGAWKERAEPQILAAGMTLHWHVADLGSELLLSPAQILDILRILQESVTNVIHHASGKEISVGAQLKDGWLIIRVTDDGKGLRDSDRIGKGLANMRRRAASLDGELRIEADGMGTSILLSVPVSLAR